MEKGHAKNLEHFQTLKSFVVSWGAVYNPPNAAVKLPNLTLVNDNAAAALEALRQQNSELKLSISQREDMFEGLNKLVTRVMNALIASGVPDSVVEDARTFARKVQGKRAAPAAVDDPDTPENEADASNSASQQSYTQRVEAFKNLVNYLETVAAYDTNEDDLKIVNLNALADDLAEKNLEVISARTNVDNAIVHRDNVFYADQTGLVDVAKMVKAYVKAAFGTDSSQFQQIENLSFRTDPR